MILLLTPQLFQKQKDSDQSNLFPNILSNDLTASCFQVTEEAITTVVLPGEVQVEGEVGAAPPDPRILNVPPPSCPEML